MAFVRSAYLQDIVICVIVVEHIETKVLVLLNLQQKDTLRYLLGHPTLALFSTILTADNLSPFADILRLDTKCITVVRDDD